MHHFAYRNGVLHAEAVNLDTLAAGVGTPFYCYSTATLERHYRVFSEAFAGENIDVAIVEPEGRAALSEFDDFARHYEVAFRS